MLQNELLQSMSILSKVPMSSENQCVPDSFQKRQGKKIQVG